MFIIHLHPLWECFCGMSRIAQLCNWKFMLKFDSKVANYHKVLFQESCRKNSINGIK